MKRWEYTQKHHIDTIVKFYSEQGWGKTKRTVMKKVRKLQEKYFPIFLDDGFTEKDAVKDLNESFAHIIRTVPDCKSQGELEARVKEETNKDPTLLYPSDALEYLPAIMEIMPFELDMRRWMQAAVKADGEWDRIKEALRYRSLWMEEIGKRERNKIMHRLLATEKSWAAHSLAVYSAIILKTFATNQMMIKKMFKTIIEANEPLPLLSELPIERMPAEFQKEVKIWTDVEEPTMQTDNIIPVRHINNFAGTCVHLEGCHHSTAMEASNWEYGDATILYVKNKPVASVKMIRDRSVIGLRTARDSKGRLPLVLDGVYVTTEEITRAAEEAFHKQGKWARLDVETLPLFPLRFAGGEGGVEQTKGYAYDLLRTRDILDNGEKPERDEDFFSFW
jgi:hypothetical protein